MSRVWVLVRIAFGTLLVSLNTLLHVPALLFAALLKAILPWRPWRRLCDRMLMTVAESWISVNTAMMRTFTRTKLQVQVDAELRGDGHYLVLANHRSWVDIPVLQAVFNRRIPLLRFFLKSQLFWVPLLGLAWWALDFPFMKRYSREQLRRRPDLAGRDMEATRRACRKFQDIPVSIMNFAEGTRFTVAKHARQASAFINLLKPKAGGVGFVLDAMGNALHAVLDVTIGYPGGRATMADLFCNRIPEVRVHVREIPIPQELIGADYEGDPAVRARAQQWINEVWRRKDERLAHLLRKSRDA